MIDNTNIAREQQKEYQLERKVYAYESEFQRLVNKRLARMKDLAFVHIEDKRRSGIVDLIIWFAGLNFVIELKKPNSSYGVTPLQQDFMDEATQFGGAIQGEARTWGEFKAIMYEHTGDARFAPAIPKAETHKTASTT